jgi:Protein of unknown function (DUF2867)
MRLPGRAWLQFEVEPAPGGSTIRQTAIFDPAGLAGLLYWYGIYPIHARVFRGMLRGIAATAVRSHEEHTTTVAAPASSLARRAGRQDTAEVGTPPRAPDAIDRAAGEDGIVVERLEKAQRRIDPAQQRA